MHSLITCEANRDYIEDVRAACAQLTAALTAARIRLQENSISEDAITVFSTGAAVGLEAHANGVAEGLRRALTMTAR